MEEKKLGAFATTVREIVKNSGCDKNLIEMMTFHFKNLLKDFNRERCTREEYLNRLMSHMFVNQMHLYKPPPDYETDMDENKAWMIPPVPVELFFDTRESAPYRKTVFFQCLEEGDVLECSIVSVLENMYDLHVMHKYRITKVVSDLKIKACFPKENSKTVYHEHEFVRVVVSGINRIVGENRDPEIWVTDDGADLPVNKRPKLGKINWNEMPFYVFKQKDLSRFPSYIAYLKNQPAFQNLLWINKVLTTNFGVDPTTLFSTRPSCFKCPEEDMLMKSRLDDAQKNFQSADNEMKAGNLDQALLDATTAIEICPKTDSLASKLYFLRARIYELKAHPKVSRKCILDLVDAIKLNSDEKVYIEKLVYHVSWVACSLYHDKDYEEATKLVESCLALDKDNSKILILQRRLEEKMKKLAIVSPEERATEVSSATTAQAALNYIKNFSSLD